MRERTDIQKNLVKKYFNTAIPVLDLGCGYGRQCYMMARNEFDVTGVDNSSVFIDIGKELIAKHKLNAKFLCASVMDFRSSTKYKQVTLFDVIEHFRSAERIRFMKHLAENICDNGATVILSFPYMNGGSLKDRLINMYKYFTSPISFLSAGKEHPYPIPFKNDFRKIFSPYFNLKECSNNNDTVFFVLEKE